MTDHLAEHLADMRTRGRRPRTIDVRRWAIRRMMADIKHDPATATRAQIERWARKQRGAASTVSWTLTQASQYIDWARRRGYRKDNPLEDIGRPHRPRRLPRPIGEDDLADAMRCADDRMRAILALAGWAGLRACEIAGLRWQDIDRRGGWLVVVEGKGGHQRAVPLHPVVVDALAALGWHPRGPVLAHEGRPVLPITISRLASRHLRSVGVTATLHQLRHRYGTEAYRGSKDLRVVQELLGHADPSTTALYTAVDEDRLRAAVANIPA